MCENCNNPPKNIDEIIQKLFKDIDDIKDQSETYRNQVEDYKHRTKQLIQLVESATDLDELKRTVDRITM